MTRKPRILLAVATVAAAAVVVPVVIVTMSGSSVASEPLSPYSDFQLYDLEDLQTLQVKLTYVGPQKKPTQTLAFTSSFNTLDMSRFVPYRQPDIHYSNDDITLRTCTASPEELDLLIDKAGELEAVTNGGVAADPFVSFMLFNSTEAGDKCFDVVLNQADTAALFDKIGLAFQGSCLQAVQLTGLSLDVLTDGDADGLADDVESLILGTDPLNHDSDVDGLSDGYEVLTFGTDPLLPDTDDDGCADGEEVAPEAGLGGTRDPLNPYDFYDVPVPTAFSGGTLADRDQAVSILNDVLAVLEYSGCSDGGPPNGLGRQYNQDNNGDTLDDGLLYDRSVGPTWSAAPDGAVSILADVLLVLAQSGHSCQAPP